MSRLTVAELRERAPAIGRTDTVVQDVLDEVEEQLARDIPWPGTVPLPGQEPLVDLPDEAWRIAKGDVVRRALRTLARDNSPEMVLGGDSPTYVGRSDPDSTRALYAIRRTLGIPSLGAG